MPKEFLIALAISICVFSFGAGRFGYLKMALLGALLSTVSNFVSISIADKGVDWDLLVNPFGLLLAANTTVLGLLLVVIFKGDWARQFMSRKEPR